MRSTFPEATLVPDLHQARQMGKVCCPGTLLHNAVAWDRGDIPDPFTEAAESNFGGACTPAPVKHAEKKAHKESNDEDTPENLEKGFNDLSEHLKQVRQFSAWLRACQ